MSPHLERRPGGAGPQWVLEVEASPHETPPHNPATSRNGVRKLLSETAKGVSQRKYDRSEYSRDEVAGGWGESLWGGMALLALHPQHPGRCDAYDPGSP